MSLWLGMGMYKQHGWRPLDLCMMIISGEKGLPLVTAIGIGIVMCVAFGIAGRPLAPILLNMRFVLHACAGHWRVDIAWHVPWGFQQWSWPLERALDSGMCLLHGHNSDDSFCVLVSP